MRSLTATEAARRFSELLDAHREALGDLLEIVVVPGGHTVLWDALAETVRAVSTFLQR